MENSKETVVLVTGAGGFIGTAVMENLRRAGRLCRSPDAITGLSVPKSLLDVVRLDRRNAIQGIAQARRARPSVRLVILHLAWPDLQSYSAGARGSAPVASSSWKQYRDWTKQLAVAAEDAGAWVFGVGSGVERYALTDPPVLAEPYLSYARRKAQIRGVLAARPMLRHRWLRLHFAFGPHESPRRLVPTALHACQNGSEMPAAAPWRRRRWLHVAEIAEAILFACAHPLPEDWDIVGPCAVTFEALYAAIETTIGRPLRRHLPDLPTADADCPDIVPANPAPFMPDSVGGAEYLVSRLQSYWDWIKREGS